MTARPTPAIRLRPTERALPRLRVVNAETGAIVCLDIYHGSNEWSALYVDGLHACHGDHYVITEAIEEAIAHVHDSGDDGDDFMRGSNTSGDVADTTAEIEAYASARRNAEAEAIRLEAEADALRQRAAALRAGVTP